jgi:predicted Zn-dependent protease
MAQIEALLADDPADPFLRYGLAMEYVSAGDDVTAAQLLTELIASTPDRPYVPAFLMAGQVLNRLGRVSAACDVLRTGIEAARVQGNDHALGEMEGLLVSIE